MSPETSELTSEHERSYIPLLDSSSCWGFDASTFASMTTCGFFGEAEWSGRSSEAQTIEGGKNKQ